MGTKSIIYGFFAGAFAALALFSGLPAYASEPLAFDKPLSERSRALIDDFARQKLQLEPGAIAVAAADLNGDGLNEYIVKNKDEFRILAENNDTIIELGALSARAVVLGDSYSGGIRDILAQQSPENDFDLKRYVWEPLQARYILSE